LFEGLVFTELPAFAGHDETEYEALRFRLIPFYERAEPAGLHEGQDGGREPF